MIVNLNFILFFISCYKNVFTAGNIMFVISVTQMNVRDEMSIGLDILSSSLKNKDDVSFINLRKIGETKSSSSSGSNI